MLNTAWEVQQALQRFVSSLWTLMSSGSKCQVGEKDENSLNSKYEGKEKSTGFL